MVGLSRGVLEARLDIFSFQIRVIFKDLFLRHARGKQIKDAFDTDTHTTDARSAAALSGVEGNSIKIGHLGG
jgi:hypothetical protein